MTSIEDEDLYGFMGVAPEATSQEIQKAYRKLCLTCHPDKFPNNPEKANKFLKLTKILDILMDEKQRKAYDAKLSARRLHQQRKAGLDAKTKAHRDILEERERTAKRQKTEHQAAQHDLDAEIRKLREEGLRKIEEENRRRQKEVEEMKKEQRKKECQIIVSCEDASDVPSEARLRSILQGYGNIVSLLQKGKLAIAEYDKPESAAKAISALNKHPVYNYSVKSSAGPEAMRKYDSVVQTATAHGYNTVTVGGHSADVQESRESMYQAHLDFERQILLQMGFDPDQQK